MKGDDLLLKNMCSEELLEYWEDNGNDDLTRPIISSNCRRFISISSLDNFNSSLSSNRVP